MSTSRQQGATDYVPLAESDGGWRVVAGGDQAWELAGVDVEALAPARAWNAQHGVPSSIDIVRRGYLVAEWYENGTDPDSRFNIHSCTKSFTGTAFGLLFEDARRGMLGEGRAVDQDSNAYAHIPAGYPLTDPRKERITLRHLLSMSSGIPGESIGIFGVLPEPGINAFEAALGRFPLRGREVPGDLWAARLAAEPGEKWDYSDPAFAHLALVFAHLTGRELADFMQERVFGPIGIENLTWETLGIDDERVGRHSNLFSGIHISARELARFGYLMLRGGAWGR